MYTPFCHSQDIIFLINQKSIKIRKGSTFVQTYAGLQERSEFNDQKVLKIL